MFEFLTNECVSDHNERIRSIQIDKNVITQTFRMYNFMKLYIRNVWVIKFFSICIDIILSLRSETHSLVKNSNIIVHSLITGPWKLKS